MKISYNSLKKYIDLTIDYKELSQILTDIGLEVDSIEEFESIKGSLEGLVIGKVITKEKHPDADKLSLTTVDIGTGELLPIVCGAPNVDAGQTVVVATIGTKLYFDDKEIIIKKGKIRGAESHGMICAEDELGLGKSHAGIMVLPNDVKIGTLAKDYFKIEKDFIFEIGLTPNRVDAASHIGVARDLSAYLLSHGNEIIVKKPDVDFFKIDNKNFPIDIKIENTQACKRYAGVTISGITIKESPEWLQNHLKSLGLKPINNVVDITNFVLFETGQPLHTFDTEYITGKQIIVKTQTQNTLFTTLDQTERKLSSSDLMICNENEAMCIAGVFGGIKSGVSENTKSVFLESAYFNPVFVRKSAKFHGLQTDASFRFERGVDPNNIIYALKRAALLIKEYAGGEISSEILDIYPEPILDFKVEVCYSNINRLIGKEIPKEAVKTILNSLEIKIIEENSDRLTLNVPPFRVDVTREADIIEEILRIYGYNNIETSLQVKSTLANAQKPDSNQIKNYISDFLTAQGFFEAMSNSLTKGGYFENNESFDSENSVKIINPLSSDLNVMRQSLLYGCLEAVSRNLNYKTNEIKLFEFGNVYLFNSKSDKNNLKSYHEENHLAIVVSGSKNQVNWISPEEKSSFFFLKTEVESILKKMNYCINNLIIEETSNKIFAYGLKILLNNNILTEFGSLSRKNISNFDIDQEVFYADFNWNLVLKNMPSKSKYVEISKYPRVKRDLALLLNKEVKFAQIKDLAFQNERKLLKEVSIFDVYQNEKLGENKKSYAVSFILEDETQTLTDKQIDKVMSKLRMTFEKELNAELR